MDEERETDSLKTELMFCYELIRLMLNTFLEKIYSGGVADIDQQAFWMLEQQLQVHWGKVSRQRGFNGLVAYDQEIPQGKVDAEAINQRIAELVGAIESLEALALTEDEEGTVQ
jgi:hypothetical protein